VYRPDRHPQTGSREVDWFAVAEFAAPLLARFPSLPLPGTPAWCSLPDSDPAKLAALVNAARYWALHATARQESMAQASQAVSAGADWGVVGRQIQHRGGSYIPRRPR
jgi:hypothetical protein